MSLYARCVAIAGRLIGALKMMIYYTVGQIWNPSRPRWSMRWREIYDLRCPASSSEQNLQMYVRRYTWFG